MTVFEDTKLTVMGEIQSRIYNTNLVSIGDCEYVRQRKLDLKLVQETTTAIELAEVIATRRLGSEHLRKLGYSDLIDKAMVHPRFNRRDGIPWSVDSIVSWLAHVAGSWDPDKLQAKLDNLTV